MPTAPSHKPSCSPKPKGSRTLSLPVLPSSGAHRGDRNAWEPGHSKIKHSRVGKWRAGVLIGIHVIMAIHIAQWLLTGLTVSPVEPSESMYTLRDGIVNAGFVFFLLAILSTLIFGRFFCGWGCHIVAVQDLCAWIMMRVGVKPKPFRARLLMLVPVGLAIYMFAWPVLARKVVAPLLADEQGRMPKWFGQVGPLPGVRTEFLVQDFWATFAAWYVAIPFIFVCGVATVYFLGAKAFCTYGCPYGGIFGPVDLLAPGRIRVTDSCEHCGHCTAVCTSNVRVHEEVRDFGMVVDPGCMKCMDCVSVCPNDALYLGVGMPALFAKPREGAKETAAKAKALKQSRFDLTWPEEIFVGLLFLVLFWCYRAMFNQVPMLMAVAMAGIGAWAAWRTWRLLRDPNSRVHGFQLRRLGKLRPWGAVFALATVLSLAIAGWSGYVRWHLLRAQLIYQQFETPVDVVLRPDFSPSTADVALARAGLEHYRKGSPPAKDGSGGVAVLWPLRADELVNVAYLHLVLGEEDQAETTLREIIRVGHPKDALVFQLAQIMTARAQREAQRLAILGANEADTKRIMDASEAGVVAMYKDALARHDDLFGVRDQLLRRRASAGDKVGALVEWSAALDRHPHNVDGLLAAAKFFADGGDVSAAKAALERALAQHKPKPEQVLFAGQIAAGTGERKKASELASRAAKEGLKLPGPRISSAQLLIAVGESENAVSMLEEGLTLARAKPPQDGSTGAILGAGFAYFRMNKPERGMPLIREAIERAGTNVWELIPIGSGLRDAGSQLQNAEMLSESVRVFERARDAAPEMVSVRNELAVAYYFAGKTEQAVQEIKKAAEMAPTNPHLPEQASRMLEDSGQHNEASRWRAMARERAAAAAPKKP